MMPIASIVWHEDRGWNGKITWGEICYWKSSFLDMKKLSRWGPLQKYGNFLILFFVGKSIYIFENQWHRFKKNIARIANVVPVTLYSRVTVNVESVVLNCQKYNQCLKCHKSQGLFFEDFLHLSLSFSSSSYLSLSLSFCWSGHVSSSLWSKVSKVTSL